jgi:phenylacetate-CoA ligase
MTTTTTVAGGFDRLRVHLQTDLLAKLPEHLERLRWSRTQIEAAQRDGLRALLAHAMENSPFHRRRLSGIEPALIDLPDLTRLPVMTKPEMMASLDDVFTDRRLNRAMVEEALAATTSEPIPILSQCTALASGGVSGQRGVFVFDHQARVDFIMSGFRPQMARFASVGGAPTKEVIVCMVAAASAVHGTGSMPAWSGEAAYPSASCRFRSLFLWRKLSIGSTNCNQHPCPRTPQYWHASLRNSAAGVCASLRSR